MMNQNVQYDFCPRCGALMHNGVCQSCEYSVNVNQTMTSHMNAENAYNPNPSMGNIPNQNQENNLYQNQPYQNQQYQNQPYQNQQYQNQPYQNQAGMGIPQMQPPKKSNTGVIVGIIIGSVLLVFLIAAVAIFGITAFIKFLNTDADEWPDDGYSSEDEYEFDYDYDYDSDYDNDYEFDYNYDDEFDFGTIEEPDIWDDIPNATLDDEEAEDTDDGLIDLDGDGIGDLDYDGGADGLDAEYYPSITDYIRYDLSYSVEFKEYTNNEGTAVCYYPYLTGDKEFIPYYNNEFYEIAEETEELAASYDCQVSSVAYVTYMDEEVLSVVFIDVYSFDEDIYYEDIYCYSFDMTNGEVLDFVLTDMSDEFLNDLESRCLEQSTADAVYLFEEYDNEELRDIFENYEHSVVAFYTPLGMEIGITYEGYWCCATYKDYENYIAIAQEESTEF